jgi:hypothetical protein
LFIFYYNVTRVKHFNVPVKQPSRRAVCLPCAEISFIVFTPEWKSVPAAKSFLKFFVA